MKRLTLLWLAGCMVAGAFAQNKVVVKQPADNHKIDRHIYGHFAEHLGRCIYDGFYVGDKNNKIPNKNGIRLDVVEAMKKLKIPNLRWPGGCFADTYHWKDGIGPKEKRPTIVNTWWGGVTEDNSFGTNEFLNMCELLGAEPYLAANVGTGTPQELIDWVQYVSFAGESPMSKLRRENGRDKPWNVKFWGVGNEAWGCGGNMRPEYYVDKYREYSTFMSGWSNDSKIYRIAAGANSGDLNWTETLVKNIPKGLIEGIGLHHYAVINWNKKGSATDFDEQQYFTTIKNALYMDELINKNEAILDKYDPTRKLGLIVDEWGGWYEVEPGTNPGFLYQQNTMRDAVLAASTLNIFNNHSSRVRMANLAQAINVLQSVILTQEEKMILTPTYHVMEMYTVHHDATYLPIDVQTDTYQVGDQKLPAVSVSASKDSVGAMHITLANIDMGKKQEVSIDLSAFKPGKLTGRILTSAKVQDHNTFNNPNKITPVAFNGASLKNNMLTVTLPPFSVVALELK